jgi:glycosyltransferase involved in cell wall biosynthesis
MPPAPLFSVVIPTFNRRDLVPRAIESVLSQTSDDFEIIVVDDGSTDDTGDVVRGIADPRIRLVSLTRNQGPAAARNAGIAVARGELISLLDSDDEYLPTFLERTRIILGPTDSRVGFCWAGTQKTSKTNIDGLCRETIWRRVWHPQFPSRHDAWRYCLTHDAPWGTNNGVTIKAPVLVKCGLFDEAMRACEDDDLLIRLMRNFEFVVIPEYLVVVHLDAPRRVDENLRHRADAWARIYGKYRDDIDPDPSASHFFLNHVARQFRIAGQPRKALSWILQWLVRRPVDPVIYRAAFRHVTGLQRAPAGPP